MDATWYFYLWYNHIKHFWRNSIVDRLNRHGIHCIQFSDERIKRYAGKRVHSKNWLNNEVYNRIMDGKPFLVSRLGGSETKFVVSYLQKDDNDRQKALTQLCELSGFFPNKKELGEEFAKQYLNCIKEIDICGIWRFYMEDYILHEYAPYTEFTVLEWLEPWRASDNSIPWSAALQGKKVLIVHPFAKSIEEQYSKHREQIFKEKQTSEYVLPEFLLSSVTAVQSLGGDGVDGYNNWFEALDHMTDQIREKDFDIAIIGCGAYGLPLAVRVKDMGKQVIHLAGATQLMFGIMGGRWEKTPEIAGLVNDSWIKPSADETPRCSDNIEKGCYW